MAKWEARCNPLGGGGGGGGGYYNGQMGNEVPSMPLERWVLMAKWKVKRNPCLWGLLMAKWEVRCM